MDTFCRRSQKNAGGLTRPHFACFALCRIYCAANISTLRSTGTLRDCLITILT